MDIGSSERDNAVMRVLVKSDFIIIYCFFLISDWPGLAALPVAKTAGSVLEDITSIMGCPAGPMSCMYKPRPPFWSNRGG